MEQFLPWSAYWNDRSEEYYARMGEGSHSVDQVKQRICRDAWRLFHLAQFLELSPIELHDLSPDDAETLLQWLNDFPSDQHSPVWLEAYEDSFRKEILGKISAHRGTVPELETRPHAQLVLCIDVRSESFRRHIEAQGPYETFGFAGFFAIPLSHQAFDSDQRGLLVSGAPHSEPCGNGNTSIGRGISVRKVFFWYSLAPTGASCVSRSEASSHWVDDGD